MEKLAPLRPELVSVCLLLAPKGAGQVARQLPRAGVLPQLGTGQRLQ